MDTKICSRCKTEHPLSFFHKDAQRKSGLTAHCKDCVRIEGQQWRANNKAKCNETSRRWKAANRDRDRRNIVKRLYGITAQDLAALVSSQNNKCAGCLIEFSGSVTPCIDHNHSTGAVRGLLCRKCNTSAGQTGDNPETLERLAAYLRRDLQNRESTQQ